MVSCIVCFELDGEGSTSLLRPKGCKGVLELAIGGLGVASEVDNFVQVEPPLYIMFQNALTLKKEKLSRFH